MAVSKSGVFVSPAYPLEKVCDPTGAGDTFAGGFLGSLSRARRCNENAFRKALVYGSIMASFAVESYDIKGLARLNRRLVERRYRHFRQISTF